MPKACGAAKIAHNAGNRVAHATSIDRPGVVSTRIQSIDALRGLVMFMMIFVNDLAGAGRVVPDWMVHFSDRHHGGSGMTFVDLVFPAFLFLVGMSIPPALGDRLAKGQSVGEVLAHVAIRAVSLMAIGILMVNETPDTAALGWSGNWWCVLMYLSAIAAFCSILPPPSAGEPPGRTWRIFNRAVRCSGFVGLVWLGIVFRGPDGRRIIALAPFSIHASWYGILGLIGWAYLVASAVFLVFRHHRAAILASMALLMCLFAADRSGLFEGFWLNRIVGIGGGLVVLTAGLGFEAVGHELLRAAAPDSAAARWLNKKVIGTRVLDDMESPADWRSFTTGAPEVVDARLGADCRSCRACLFFSAFL